MLSLALIVKNEEKNLRRCLNSCAGLWDELVIVDTGSTDSTVEIAKSYTDRIFNFEWVDDFSKARNFAFSICTQPWIMWIDADDILKPTDIAAIKSEMRSISKRSDINYVLINYHYWVEPACAENGWQDTPKATQMRERIIRNGANKWVDPIHEHIPILYNQSTHINGAAVWHMRDDEDFKADSDRNIRILEKVVKENPSARAYYYLGDELKPRNKKIEAIAAYKQAYKLHTDPNYLFQSAYKIGQCYRELASENESDRKTLKLKAIHWYKKSLNHEIKYREPLIELANIFFNDQEYHKAIFWLESSINLPEPAAPQMCVLKHMYTWLPYDFLAQSYYNIGDYKKCIEYSERLYEANPTKTYALQNIQAATAKLHESYKQPETPVKLNLGSGPKRIDGYLSCDLFEHPDIDEIFSLDEIPYADNTVAAIYSEHSLEHLPRPKAEAAIIEWARVLKPGGQLTLKIPDLELCCQKFLENPALQDSWYMHTIYGVQDYRGEQAAGRPVPFPRKVNYGQIHYTGFTKARIRKLLESAGFRIDNLYNYDGWDTPSICVEASIPGGNPEAKTITFVNNSLWQKYMSYGDYWLDAFRASGHNIQTCRYEHIDELKAGSDMYFFIEIRYDPSTIPAECHPRVLRTQENPPVEQLAQFDLVLTPDSHKAALWTSQGITVQIVPESQHEIQVSKLLNEAIQKGPVDIIIPSYKNLKYLQLAVESVRYNTENYNLIVVNSGPDEAVREWLQAQPDIYLIDTPDKSCFSASLNKALNMTINDVVLLNNDVIVGKGWLEGLASSPFDITNPFSNCDAGWIHNEYPVIGGVRLKPNMLFQEVNFIELLKSGPVPNSLETYRSAPWVAFYATYIKRSVVSRVGLLDETFQNGGEDFDYCRRATKLGFKCGYAFNSWVFHFGGKTRKVSEEENPSLHVEEDKFNNSYMQHKAKQTVAIYCGPAWERWTVENINTTGIGGSETCAALLAKEFASKGYRAVILGDCHGLEGTYDGVEYIDYRRYDEFIQTNYIDYFISSRTLAPLQRDNLPFGQVFVWAHDIFIPGIPSGSPLPGDNRVSKYVCLSPWHVNFFSQWHRVDTSRIMIQGNGLDLSRYQNKDQHEKDPYKLIYSSSPDRGLIHLLRMFPALKAEFKDLSLHVYYGFFNWESAIRQRNNPQEVALLEELKALMEQDGVVYHGRVSQQELAVAQMSASIWAYPTEFTETYCITAIECMLAGAVPVCTTLAALETTVPEGCGVKVGSYTQVEEAVRKLLKNPAEQARLRKAGEAYVLKNCGWGRICDSWISMFNRVV